MLFRSLTEREDDLRKEKDFTRLLLDTSPAFIVGIGTDGRTLMMNRSLLDALEYTAAEVQGRDYLTAFVPEEDRAELRKVFDDIINEGRETVHRNRIASKSGRFYHVEWHGRMVSPRRGEAGLFVGVGVDLTESLEHDRALHEFRDMVKTVMDSVPLLITYVDREERYMYANDAYAEWYGMTREELIGKRVSEVLTPEVYERASVSIQRVLSGTPVAYENRAFDREGRERIVSVRYEPHLSRGEVLGFFSMITDITERRRTEEILQESEKRFHALAEYSPMGIYLTDLGGDCLYVNSAWREMAGLTSEEACGKGWLRALHPEDREEIGEKWFHSVESRRRWGYEYRFVTPGGRITWVRGMTAALFDDRGSLNGFVGINIDITEDRERNREQEAMVHILGLINEKEDLHEFMEEVCLFVSEWSGCEAVGIRLREGEDYPYYETRGFPGEFVRVENSLCTYDLEGQLMRDDVGDPVLECMCGNILCGRFDPAKPFFSVGGSFWSNCTTELLASTTEEDRQARTRNRCNGMGYESVALIPLRMGGETFGLLQLNDRRRNRFTPGMIASLERLCGNIAMALEHRRLAEETRINEERFRLVADYTADWEYWIDQEGKLIYISPSCEAITGYTREEFINNPGLMTDILHPEDRDRVVEHCVHSKNPETPFQHRNLDFRILHKNGSAVWIGHRCQPVFAAEGEWQGIRGSNRDITRRKRAEETLNQREKWMRGLINATEESAFLLTNDGTVLVMNEGAARRMGRTVGDFTGKNIYAYLPAAVAELRREKAAEVIRTGQPVRFEDERDGIVFDNRICPVIDEEGHVSHLAIFGLDVTERRESEGRLRESEAMYRFLAEQTRDIVWTADLSLRTTYVSPSVEVLLGFTPEERLRQPLEEQLTPESCAEVMRVFAEEMRREKEGIGDPDRSVTLEFHCYRKDGTTCWVENIISGVRDEKGDLTAFHGVARDITERKRTEERIALMAAIADNAPNSITVHDREGHFLYANEKTFRMHGWGRDEFLKLSLYDVDIPESAELIAGRMQIIEEQGEASFEVRHRQRDGGVFPLEVFVKKIDWMGIPAFLSIATDIAGRKQSEEAITALLKEKEILLREVHHRIKNNLNMIASLLSLQARSAKGKSAETMMDARGRVMGMISLYELIYQSQDYRNVDLESYLRAILDEIVQVSGSDKRGIGISGEIGAMTVAVEVSLPLGIIVNELVTNALKHAFAGRDKGAVKVELKMTGPGVCSLLVADNGRGYPEGASAGEGKGFGLTLVDMLVRQLGGELHTGNEGGALFLITFPVDHRWAEEAGNKEGKADEGTDL